MMSVLGSELSASLVVLSYSYIWYIESRGQEEDRMNGQCEESELWGVQHSWNWD